MGRTSTERGVALLELALTLPLVLFIVLSFLDLARCLAVKHVLSKGAHNGLSLAVTVAGIDGDPTSSAFITAQTAVINEATEFPTSTLVSTSSTSGAALLSAELIRPGESGHPTAPSPMQPWDSYQSLMVNEPLIVRLRARVALLTPLFQRSLIIEGSAIGYRENTTQSL